MMRKFAIMAATVAAAVGLGTRPAQAQTQVTCESVNGAQRVCAMDTRGGVRLVKSYSLSPCDEGRTWGLTRGGVWVTGGCRATFVTTGVSAGSGNYNNTYGNGNYNNNNGWNSSSMSTADNMCRQAVRQRLGNRRLRTAVQNTNRNNVRIAWESANGYTGTCRVNRNGNVTVNVAR